MNLRAAISILVFLVAFPSVAQDLRLVTCQEFTTKGQQLLDNNGDLLEEFRQTQPSTLWNKEQVEFLITSAAILSYGLGVIETLEHLTTKKSMEEKRKTVIDNVISTLNECEIHRSRSVMKIFRQRMEAVVRDHIGSPDRN